MFSCARASAGSTCSARANTSDKHALLVARYRYARAYRGHMRQSSVTNLVYMCATSSQDLSLAATLRM